MRVTRHAVQRYGEHHPGAVSAEVVAAVEAGTALDPDFAQAMLGRSPRRVHDASYVASADNRGIFVVCGNSIVTYARLGAYAVKALTPAADPAPPPPVVVLQSPSLSPGDIWQATGGRHFLVEAVWPGAVRLQRVRLGGAAEVSACRARLIPWRFPGQAVGWPQDFEPQKARRFLVAVHARAERGDGPVMGAVALDKMTEVER